MSFLLLLLFPRGFVERLGVGVAARQFLERPDAGVAVRAAAVCLLVILRGGDLPPLSVGGFRSVHGVRPHGRERDDEIEEIKRLDALLEYALPISVTRDA